jgi:hypothetical protein
MRPTAGPCCLPQVLSIEVLPAASADTHVLVVSRGNALAVSSATAADSAGCHSSRPRLPHTAADTDGARRHGGQHVSQPLPGPWPHGGANTVGKQRQQRTPNATDEQLTLRAHPSRSRACQTSETTRGDSGARRTERKRRQQHRSNDTNCDRCGGASHGTPRAPQAPFDSVPVTTATTAPRTWSRHVGVAASNRGGLRIKLNEQARRRFASQTAVAPMVSNSNARRWLVTSRHFFQCAWSIGEAIYI